MLILSLILVEITLDFYFKDDFYVNYGRPVPRNVDFNQNDVLIVNYSHLVYGIGNYTALINDTNFSNPFSVVNNFTKYYCLSPTCNLSFIGILPLVDKNVTKIVEFNVRKYLKFIFLPKKVKIKKDIWDSKIYAYFSTKDKIDIKNFFAYKYYVKSRNIVFLGQRGTYVYHLGHYSYLYTYSYSDRDLSVYYWNYDKYDYLGNRKLNRTDSYGSIVPDIRKEYKGLVKYSFSVEQSSSSRYLISHHFPLDLELFIPAGIHTLEEVKKFNSKFNYREHYLDSLKVVENMFNTALDTDNIDISDDDAFDIAIMYLIMGGLLFILLIVNCIYGHYIADEFGLDDDVLGDDASEPESIDNSENL